MTASLARDRPLPAKLAGYAQLARPANLVTAAADIAAGYAIAGAPGFGVLVLLAFASMLLYAGGVVLNDAFDAPRDAHERPERPIPSGRVTRTAAFVFGAILLGAGVVVAAAVARASLAVAVAIAFVVLVYNAYAKHRMLLGPASMASARALNLLLGVSSAPALLLNAAPFALLSFAHVAMLTLVSRGETGGTNHRIVNLALATALALGPILVVTAPAPWTALPFAAAYAGILLPNYWRLRARPDAASVRRAVRSGVLALIMLDAALAAGHAGWVYGIGVLALWPLAVILARRFSVS